jgi:signal transduction histidine kinase
MLGLKWLRKLDERRLKVLLGVFFLALAVPAAVLITQAYGQLKWEAFRRNQLLAEDLAAQVDSGLRTAVATEEARAFGDYSFLVVAGKDAAANFVQRSPLSTFPVEGAVPGTLGYFQVDALGNLTTPLLPESNVDAATYGISADEQSARRTLFASLSEVLAANRLVLRSPEAPAAGGALSPAPASASASRALRSSAAPASAAPPPSPRSDVENAPSAAFAPSVEFTRDAARKLQAQMEKAEATQAAFDRLAPNATAAENASATQNASAVQNAAEEAKVRKEVEVPKRQVTEAPPQAFELNKDAQSGAKVAGAADAAAPSEPRAQVAERRKRSEQSVVPEPKPAERESDADKAVADSKKLARTEFRVQTFESELDPLEVGLLDTGDIVMFRNVWRGGQRYIQGALIDRAQFVERAVASAYRASSLAAMSDVAVTYRGRPLATLRAATAASYESRPVADLAGTPLHRARLSPPFGDLELVFSVNQLPSAPGALLLLWISVTLAAVLCGGFYFMYRFAVGQLRLARQQQDFVSAVSHELKTPLTSIRMYGEMLKAGWADDAKKQTYYDYIHSESERLSRLIENVLQLARLTRNSQQLDVKRIASAELLDMVRSKCATQAERAGFVLTVRDGVPAGTELVVDADAFAQVLINLVDNALKFSSTAERKEIEIASRLETDGWVLYTVRDFGPGVPKGQMKKIFELFYRPPDELTRATAGTGIGLALVRELTAAMGGRVEVRNCEPGAEFRVSFPAERAAA